VTLGAGRRLQDLSDLPVISPVLNSLLAQEGGRDHGDYVLLTGATLGFRHRVSGRTALLLSGGVQESRSVDTRATPATGSYRANPALAATPPLIASEAKWSSSTTSVARTPGRADTAS